MIQTMTWMKKKLIQSRLYSDLLFTEQLAYSLILYILYFSKMQRQKLLTPLFCSSSYKWVRYSQDEIDELVWILLFDDELHRYNKMKWNTSKQSFIALSTLIDLSLVRK